MAELVAIDLPGGPDFVTALRAAWDRGDAALPVDQRLAPGAKVALLDLFKPAAVTFAGGTSRRAGGVPVEPGDALVMATSGTTGEAKGAVLTFDAVAASARATSARLGVDPDRHRWLACLPLCHVGGLSVVTRALLTGTPFTVLPGYDHDAVMEASGPDVLVSLVVTTLARTGAAAWHTVVLGGSAPPPVVAANVVSTYGLTETGSGVVYDGRPLEGVEVRIAPPALPGGEPHPGLPGGEILVRGPMLLRGYRDGTSPLDRAGWLATGDAGRLDAEGRLEVSGRLSELIITGGENVWPLSVETILRRHPGVADVAVAGRPDPVWGQRLVAWVVPADPSVPPRLDDLRRLVRDHLVAFAAPKELILVDHLPRTAIGKVRRHSLQ